MTWARIPLFFGVLLLMAGLESAFARRPWHALRRERWFFHLVLALLNTLAYRFVGVLPLLSVFALWQERGWGLAPWLGLSGPAEIIATLIVFDLFNYFWHRANHEVDFFWRFHRAHHFDTHVDASTSLRFHIGELFLSGLVKCLWVAVWGPSLAAFVVFETAVTAASQFHHANIDLGGLEGPARALVMTPRLHAAHHTVALRSRNGNYATILLAWDKIFGTLREADETELKTLGLEGGRSADLSLFAFMKAPWGLPS